MRSKLPRFVILSSGCGSAVGLGYNLLLDKQQKRKVRTSFHSINRFFRMIGLGVHVTFDFKWSVYNIEPESPRYKEIADACHSRIAQRFFDTAILNGGLYIKFGQGLAVMNHLLHPAYVQILSRLNDMALTSHSDDVNEIIQEDLATSRDAIFSEFGKEPIAAASIATVYKAKLKSGQPVAVKVQYIDLQDRFFGDIWTIKVLMDIAEWVFPGFNFKWAVNELCDTLEQELNFINEGRNAEKCAEDLKHFKYVYVPKVYWEYSSKRILTAEFIDAFKIDDLEGMKKAGINLRLACERMCRVFGYQIFQSGFVHADPHPGNLFVRKMPNNDIQLVLLDHGLYQYVEPQVQAMILDDTDKMLQYASDLGVHGLQDTAILAGVLLQRPWYANVPFSSYFKGGVTELDLQHMNAFLENHFSRVMNVLRAIPLSLLLVIRNLNTIRSIVQTHGDTVNRYRIMTECTVAKDRNLIEYLKLRYSLCVMNAKDKLRHLLVSFLVFLNKSGLSSLPMFAALEEINRQPPPFSPAEANLS